MNNEQLQRERTLYRYTTALDRGDFATIAAIWQEAEQDPTLADMLLALTAALESDASASLANLPTTTTHSTNGHRAAHRAPAREDTPMSLYSASHSAAPSGRRRFPLTLIAALLVVALLASLLLALNQRGGSFAGDVPDSEVPAGQEPGGPNTAGQGPDGSDPNALPGMLQQTTEPDAFELTATALVAQATVMADPLAQTATAIVDDFMATQPIQVITATPIPTMTPSATYTSTPVPTASPTHTPTAFRDLTTDFPPTAVPPADMPAGAAGMGSHIQPLIAGQTIPAQLYAANDVLFYMFTAPEDGSVTITAVSPDFDPQLLVYTLDDPELGMSRNAEDSARPTVTLELQAGDRMLIFIYSRSDAAGQLLLNVSEIE